ncbi:hypothetical protein TNCV_4502471 [Trichonephila clavipes]|nr:hypothetical protein TNCV_4502471 [Trichonephila clavipes]
MKKGDKSSHMRAQVDRSGSAVLAKFLETFNMRIEALSTAPLEKKNDLEIFAFPVLEKEHLESRENIGAELAERWTELPQVSDESRSFFRVHTGYFSNIPKCIKAEFIASWACSQSSVVSSSKR